MPTMGKPRPRALIIHHEGSCVNGLFPLFKDVTLRPDICTVSPHLREAVFDTEAQARDISSLARASGWYDHPRGERSRMSVVLEQELNLLDRDMDVAHGGVLAAVEGVFGLLELMVGVLQFVQGMVQVRVVLVVLVFFAQI